MKKKIYGFQIGNQVVEQKAINEKNALKIIIENHWELINKVEKIELLGELSDDTTTKGDKKE